MKACQSLAGAVALLGLAGHARATDRPGRVAVLPIAAAASSAAECRLWRQALEQSIQEQLRLTVKGRDDVDREVKQLCGPRARWWTCYEDDQVLLAVGRALGVELAIAAKLAAMGGAYSIKLRYAQVGRGAVGTDVLEMVAQQSIRLPPSLLELELQAVVSAQDEPPEQQLAQPETKVRLQPQGVTSEDVTAGLLGPNGPAPRLAAEATGQAPTAWRLTRRSLLWFGVGTAAAALAMGATLAYQSVSGPSRWEKGDARVRLP